MVKIWYLKQVFNHSLHKLPNGFCLLFFSQKNRSWLSGLLFTYGIVLPDFDSVCRFFIQLVSFLNIKCFVEGINVC